MASIQVIQLLANSEAGTAERLEEVLAPLREAGTVQVERPADAEAMYEAAADASRRGALVVAAGGDGTVGLVARALIEHPGGTMAIVPLGTANDFARSLGLPQQPAEAARAVLTGQRRVVDAFLYSDGQHRQIGLNMASGGCGADVVGKLTDEVKQRWGALAYLRTSVTVLADLCSYQVQLFVDDRPPETLSVFNLLIGNGRTAGGGVEINPDARVDDGLLEVLAVKEGGFWENTALAARFWASHDFLDSEQVFYCRGRQIRVTSQTPMPFSIDGDLPPFVPTHFEVLPRVLPIMAPMEPVEP